MNQDMNTLLAVAIISAGLIVALALVAALVWKRLSEKAESLRKDLMDAQKQLEIEQALRQKEHEGGEKRAQESEKLLKELMNQTVAGAIEKFRTASGELLKTNGAEFAEVSRKSIADILDPLKQRIKEYDDRAKEVHQGNMTLGTELKGYVQTIRASASKIESETTGFRNDLKFNNKFQGNFGEERLELVLDRCGFTKGEDYVLQTGEEKKIPDCQVFDHLSKKVIVIDAKMSWKNYVEGFAAEDPDERARALDEHVKSVKKQIDNLAGKRYYEKKPDKEGYVFAPFSVMFVPSDGALIAALERDASLLQYAAEKSVYLTSPLNLFNLLKLLKTCLGNFDFAENLSEIAKEAKNVVDRIDSMFAELEDLGDGLKKVNQVYDKVVKRLSDGSAENKSSVRESANNMIDLSVKHEKLKSKALARAFTLLFLFAASLVCREAAGGVEDALVLWQSDAAAAYSEPALAAAPNGDLIAVCAAADRGLVMRRSADLGASWTRSVEVPFELTNGVARPMTPALLVDARAKKVFLFTTVREGDKISGSNRLAVQESSDNGVTWSVPRELTHDIAFASWNFGGPRVAGGEISICGGSGAQLSDGTLLATYTRFPRGCPGTPELAVFGSTDHGAIWRPVGRPVSNAGEGSVVERPDGAWLLNARGRRGGRETFVSTDRGETWEPRFDTCLPDPQGRGQLLRFGCTVLFANAASSEKNRLVVRASLDGGATWNEGVLVDAGAAARPDLAAMRNRDIGIVYESARYRAILFAVVPCRRVLTGLGNF